MDNEDFLKIQKILCLGRETSFGPFFAERVMARINEVGDNYNAMGYFLETLISAFKRVAIGGLAVLLLMIILNIYRREKTYLAYFKNQNAMTLEQYMTQTAFNVLEE
ncbi:MAG: hypothetical protein ABIA63_04610 [bacterium]